MRLRRATTPALVAFLVFNSSMLLFSQTVTGDDGTVIRIHRFQPTVSTQPVEPSSQTGSAKSGELSESAVAQINALEEEKQSRTATQRKINSRLLYTARMLQGHPAVPGVPVMRSGLEVDDQNNLLVDITAIVTDDLLQRLRSAGVRIVHSEPTHRLIRALIPAPQLESVAADPEVIFIMPRREARTVGTSSGLPRPMKWGVSPGFAGRAARLREKLSAALVGEGVSPACLGQGSVVSEGLQTHRADHACDSFGARGAGVTIGVLSDGVSSLATSQGTGDLGPVTVLAGQTGIGDEGTAMLEVIHDLAPDATLFFATALPTNETFAQNIRDLRTAGCDIIVDDIIYFIESPFQDGQAPSVVSEFDGGVVSQAVNDVVADGAMYFSSAGNEGNKDDASFGFTGTYEGDFVDGGSNTLLPGGKVHKFGPGTTAFDPVTSFGGDFVWLYWADPLGGSGNDYDLAVLNSTGTQVVDGSADVQNGTQDPVEGFGAVVFQGERLVVFKTTAAANRFFHLVAFNAGLAVTTPGAVMAHAGASGAFAVAAAAADTPFPPCVGCPSGPFPNPFNSTNVVEAFSSDGPRRIFFHADGTAITPGNFSSTGGMLLQKPEMTAADGVSVTGVGGFFVPFFGTSAAAPHAAAIAGLVKSVDTTRSNSEIAGFLTNTAIDIMGAGTDRDSGAGIVMAFEAVQSANAPSITSIAPVSGAVGTVVTITGKRFGAIQNASTVTFNGTAATPTLWSDTSIKAPVPAGATNGNVVVTVLGEASNGVLFTFTPHITSLTPNSGSSGLAVTIAGTNFGSTQGTSTVTFNGTTATPTTWSATSILVPVPSGATAGNVVVTVNGVASNGVNFTVPPPSITNLSPTAAPIGTAVTITGTSFGSTQGTSTVTFKGQAATVTTWTDTSIATTVPAGATTGNVVVTVNVPSNGVAFTVQDFSFQAALTDITVTAGQSKPEDFTIATPDGFDGTITFACSQLPAKSNCTFTPASVPPNANPSTTVTMTVSTTATTTSGAGPGLMGMWLSFGGFGLVLAGVGTRRRSRKVLGMVAACLLIPLLLAIVSCGSSHHTVTVPGTPPGTYPIIMKATSGPITHPANFTLKVN